MYKIKIKCIYSIKDLRNDSVIYIGQTVNYNHRKTNHFHTIGTPVDKYMFDEGRENFEMYILQKFDEDISKEEMRNKENYYIEMFDTIENGFNKRRSGNIFCKDNNEYYKEYQKSDKMREHRRKYLRQWRLKKKQEKEQINIKTSTEQ